MCNTTYKIVSKVIVNRLRQILEKVIDPAQSAFIKGRLITDNVLVSFECQHWIRNRRKGKDGYAAMKIDMSKAYDRVEWSYLKAVMGRMGFPGRIVQLIMQCVTSVSSAFVLNRAVYGEIIPTRGLRQGDPLSPFLFVLCAQGFSSLIRQFEKERKITGVPIVPRDLSISHLFFADDSLIFFKAKEEEAKAMKEVIERYEAASGQLINLDKSSISFSPNTTSAHTGEVKRILGIKAETGIQMYLGLPAYSLRQKRLQFGYIIEKAQKKLLSWNQREFSAGGKEVLIKAVIQAIPTYAMQCFRLPESICEDFDRLCAGFWWGDKETGRKMHWAKWATMCKPKEQGGLGFRDIRSFNKALLAKQVWRMLENPQSLVARVFRARYFRNGNIMEAEVKSNASFAWRSLAWSRSIIEKGRIWSVGNGHDIAVFRDQWVVGTQGHYLAFRLEGEREDMRVCELMGGNGEWDEGRLETLFLPFEIENILRTPIGEHGGKDEIKWKFDEKGKFSVKSAYLAEIGFFEGPPHTSSSDKKIWSKMVWNLSIPPKARIFFWRALSNMIPTAANLHNHHVPTDGICSLCRNRWGTTEHCLLLCPRVREIWRSSRFWPIVRRSEGMQLFDVAGAVRKEYGVDEYELWVFMVWQVWIFVCGLGHKLTEQVEETSEERCMALREVYQAARPIISAEPPLGVSIGKEKWIKPKADRFRVDVDASMNKELHLFGIGIVVRNHRGDVVVAMAKRTGPSSSAMMAEVMAVVYGITTCVEHKIEPIEIFTDSILVARLMTNPEEENELLPDDVCEILKCARENILIGVRHMLRSANRVAHALASFAMQCSSPISWTDSLPSWLQEIVIADVS